MTNNSLGLKLAIELVIDFGGAPIGRRGRRFLKEQQILAKDSQEQAQRGQHQAKENCQQNSPDQPAEVKSDGHAEAEKAAKPTWPEQTNQQPNTQQRQGGGQEVLRNSPACPKEDRHPAQGHSRGGGEFHPFFGTFLEDQAHIQSGTGRKLPASLRRCLSRSRMKLR